MNPTFNPAELSTWAEATFYARIIDSSALFLNAGIQIKPQVPFQPGVPSGSGIYLPPWSPGPHGDPEPQIGNSIWLHYRFTNGMQGMNAGLVRDSFRRYPNSPLYVLSQLLIEVQQGAPKP